MADFFLNDEIEYFNFFQKYLFKSLNVFSYETKHIKLTGKALNNIIPSPLENVFNPFSRYVFTTQSIIPEYFRFLSPFIPSYMYRLFITSAGTAQTHESTPNKINELKGVSV